MEFRGFDLDRHFPTVFNWWFKATGVGVDPTILSTTGTMAFEGEQPLAAAWLYLGNSRGLAMIGCVVANPDIGPKKKVEAVEGVIVELEEKAKAAGFSHIIMNSDQPALTKLMQRRGYNRADSHATLSKNLGASYARPKFPVEEVFC